MIAHLPIIGGWRDLLLSEWFYQEDSIPISLNKILCCLYFSTPFTRQEACIFAIPGLLCLSVYSTVGIFYYDYWDWPRLFFYLLRGFSEWLFILGVYGVTRQLVTRPPPGLARLSELAMPFYLTHQQILVPIAAACSWVPYLSKETRR